MSVIPTIRRPALALSAAVALVAATFAPVPAAFADAGLSGTVEVLPAGNGFAMSDLAAYDPVSFEAAWAQAMALFDEHLR